MADDALSRLTVVAEQGTDPYIDHERFDDDLFVTIRLADLRTLVAFVKERIPDPPQDEERATPAPDSVEALREEARIGCESWPSTCAKKHRTYPCFKCRAADALERMEKVARDCKQQYHDRRDALIEQHDRAEQAEQEVARITGLRMEAEREQEETFKTWQDCHAENDALMRENIKAERQRDAAVEAGVALASQSYSVLEQDLGYTLTGDPEKIRRPLHGHAPIRHQLLYRYARTALGKIEEEKNG